MYQYLKLMIRLNKWVSCAILVVVIVCICSSCSQKTDAECCASPYAAYTSFVDCISTSFEPTGFTRINADENLYYSVSIPENTYFMEQNDLYENDPLQPKNRKMFYIDSDKKMIVWMSFLYSEEHLEKHFLTIDEFPGEYMQDQTLELYSYLSEMFECVLEENHCIVLLKFFPLGPIGLSEDETEINSYRENVTFFIQSYCDTLRKL